MPLSQLPVAFGTPGHSWSVDVLLPPLPLLSRGVLPVCLCPFSCSSSIRTDHWIWALPSPG